MKEGIIYVGTVGVRSSRLCTVRGIFHSLVHNSLFGSSSFGSLSILAGKQVFSPCEAFLMFLLMLDGLGMSTRSCNLCLAALLWW